ncbi:MAG: phosphoribosylformylglycinamidine cyclo-ligase [Gammaproteobacteria bacterium RIFCSPHIGHO2_12_FULL_41_20]|nr:MAG: phosphoribosylformylglycinamidine cyclo-ligase [Gammaproteobacteria bacterium RIFCSPHIGHO2_12_FULL_41_20]
MSTKIDYQAAGVNIAAGNATVQRIKQAVESTFSPAVLTEIGSFGALYDLQAIFAQYHHPVLVQSIDGVGTKMLVARMLQKYDTIGMDLVSATANDIVVLGAKPLTLLDYIANDKLNPPIIEEIISGMVKACRESHIALVGGEMAEMPGTYLPGELDLVGVITGVVEKDQAILGKEIKPGDVVCALASSGLHTNGFSLARKLFFEVGKYTVEAQLPELTHTLGEELLMPHINYTNPILHVLQQKIVIKGMAHITGGGLLENIPRILPAQCAVEIYRHELPTLPLFAVLCHLGKLDQAEAYRTFNMGVGLVMIVSPETVELLRTALLAAYPQFPLYVIGQVVSGHREVRLI